MTKPLIVTRAYPRPYEPTRRVRNGLLPSHITASNLALAAHHVLVHDRKIVFQAALPIAATATNDVTWRFCFRTGEASTTAGSLKLRAVALAAPPCAWELEVTDGSTTTTSDTKQHIADITPTTWDDCAHQMVAEIDVDPDTVYYGTINRVLSGAFTSRPPISVVVYEVHPPFVDTTDAIAVDSRSFFTKGPIYDAHHQTLANAVHDLWKHNGAQLLAVSRGLDDGSGDWRRTTASYANLLDQTASTTVSASTPGFNLNTTYLNPYHTTDISAVLAVWARNPTAPGGDVKLVDASGTLGTLSGFSTAGEWKTANITLTGGARHKVDIQLQGDGSNSFFVGAVSIFAYEA